MEKRKWFEYPIALLLLLVIFALPVAIADQYAWSSVYFSVPTTISFAVSLPGAGSNISSTTTAPGGQTDDIYFNATTVNDKNVQPCRSLGGSGANCQDVGSGRPILQFKNTGTVNISLGIAWNSTPDAAYSATYNVSHPLGSCGADTACTDASNSTAISTSISVFIQNLPINNLTDLYLEGDFSNAQGGTSSAYQLLYNGTATN